MTKYNNPMIIQKDTSPYLYLTEFSGIYLNEFLPNELDRKLKIKINESASLNHHLVSFQVWIRYPKKEFTETMTVFLIKNQSEEIVFSCTPTSNSKKAKITSTSTVKFFKNGNYCESFILNSEEWTSLYIIFETPITFESFTGEISLYPNFVYNNIAQYVYENEISTITTGLPQIWRYILYPNYPSTVVTQTWQNIYDGGSWNNFAYYEITTIDYTITGDYIYSNQTGSSVLVNDDLSSIYYHSNGADIFTEVEWQKIEKPLV